MGSFARLSSTIIKEDFNQIIVEKVVAVNE